MGKGTNKLIGSAAGGIGARALGSVLFPVGGPLGIAAGALLGGTLGGLFGKSDPNKKLPKKQGKLARKRAKGKDTSKVERKIAKLKRRILEQSGGLGGLGGELQPVNLAPFDPGPQFPGATVTTGQPNIVDASSFPVQSPFGNTQPIDPSQVNPALDAFGSNIASFTPPLRGLPGFGDPLTFGQAGAVNSGEQVRFPVFDQRFNPFAQPAPGAAQPPPPSTANLPQFQGNLPQFNAASQGRFGANPFANFNRRGFGGLGGLGG